MDDLRPSETIHIDSNVLDTNDVKRDTALRIIEQHGWEPDQCVICVKPCESVSIECPATFDAELGIKSHYSIAAVRDFLGY